MQVGTLGGLWRYPVKSMAAEALDEAACVSFTRQLCAAGADHGIRALAVSPGMIRTPATQPHLDDPSNPTETLAAMTPSRRTGEPEDVARVAAFLAADEASYTNGENIMVDGGVSAMAG